MYGAVCAVKNVELQLCVKLTSTRIVLFVHAISTQRNKVVACAFMISTQRNQVVACEQLRGGGLLPFRSPPQYFPFMMHAHCSCIDEEDHVWGWQCLLSVSSIVEGMEVRPMIPKTLPISIDIYHRNGKLTAIIDRVSLRAAAYLPPLPGKYTLLDKSASAPGTTIGGAAALQ